MEPLNGGAGQVSSAEHPVMKAGAGTPTATAGGDAWEPAGVSDEPVRRVAATNNSTNIMVSFLGQLTRILQRAGRFEVYLFCACSSCHVNLNRSSFRCHAVSIR